MNTDEHGWASRNTLGQQLILLAARAGLAETLERTWVEYPAHPRSSVFIRGEFFLSYGSLFIEAESQARYFSEPCSMLTATISGTW